jgi:Dockerin type I domain
MTRNHLSRVPRSNSDRRFSRPVRLSVEAFEARDVPAASPYVIGANPAVSVQSIISAGDSVGSYRMAGIPDGLGAFDNGDGTFTVLLNHEFTTADGVAHAHNASLGTAGKGAFVDRLVIRKSDLAVLSGNDQIQTILDGSTFLPLTGTALNLNRLCSADLPDGTAFYNPATGKGLDPAIARIFMDGEETNNGRAFAHIVTGANNGTSYTLPLFAGYGGGSWENLLANPASGDTTLVVATSDNGTGNHFNKVIAYVGTKLDTGNEIQLAGLTDGSLFQIAVAGVSTEDRTNALGTAATGPIYTGTFTLTSGVGTTFLRPEDGAWDPNHPDDFYFVTTDRLDTVRDGIGTQVGRSRLWKLHFSDLSNPTAGGTIEAVLDGTEGQNMLDNMAIDQHGRIILQEDVGNAAHNGKMWMCEIATDRLVLIAKHDPARFGDIGSPATAPFNQDEETSGVIDVSGILGEGMFLFDDQAHYAFGDPAIVEGGQLMLMHVPVAATVDDVQVNDGAAQRSRVSSLTVTFGGTLAASDFAAGAFSVTRAEGGAVVSVEIQSVISAGGKTQVVLTFSGDDIIAGSLADGHYTLTIDGSKIHDALGQAADADNDGFAGGAGTSSFHRLFGDVNGDDQVDATEVALAGHAGGTRVGDADYLWYLDFDGNGLINGRDISEVARRLH